LGIPSMEGLGRTCSTTMTRMLLNGAVGVELKAFGKLGRDGGAYVFS
jgi:hypothetical protein